MPNIGNVLKQEIARIARRELRTHLEAARKASNQQRHHIADLRRKITELERKLAAVASKSGPAAAPEQASAPEANVRFVPKGLRALRERLGLSAERFGRLIGVSGQSVYNWEHQVTAPRARQLQAIAAVRGIGKREAMARLEALEATAAEPHTAARKSRPRTEKR
jgi:DNA-binding transcriptional regulator YiaG